MGNPSPETPTLTFIAGIHGLEKIGSEVVLAFLDTLIQRLEWDQSLITGLEKCCIHFIPIANPVGSVMNTRSNGNHVDLMRNAPIDAEKRPPWLVGGHRLHKHIPWYRGKKGDEMEPETLALCDFIENNLFTTPFNIVLDCHSGFGFEDRLWFPFAYSKKPIYHLSEIYALKRLLNQTYPHLNYVFEPQSKHYTAHGDLWDYLYLKSLEKNTIFLPLTMEMGSWRWVKKNPRQLASISGLFNPTIPHRLKRVLRQHIVLMEFLIRAVRSYQNWQPFAEKRAHLHSEAVRY
ncbi:M14 family metallopeptidase [Aurantivibrio plasticivorans]